MDRLGQMMVVSAIAMGALAAPGVSNARTDFSITIGPPPPVYEVVPQPRHGYAWVPGYYAWNGHRHVWKHGYWVRERRGYAYEPYRWEHRGDRWYMEGGRWRRG